MSRLRGTLVYRMPPEVTGPYEFYALLVHPTGRVMMVHSEGVGYTVTEDKPWRWNDYSDECPVFTPAQLLTLAFSAPSVDLADWIRTHNHRLEQNFHLIHGWAND